MKNIIYKCGKLRPDPLLIILFLISLGISRIYGSVYGGKAGTFLSWGAGAGAMGLGNTGVAGRSDSFSVYYNSALLGQIQKKEIGTFQSVLWENTNYSFISYVFPMLNKGCLGFSFIQLASGGATKTDEDNNIVGTFGFTQRAFSVSYGREILPLIFWGVNTKFMSSNLDKYSQMFATFDTGLLYNLNSRINIGANLGNIISFKLSDTQDLLPMIFKIGLAVKVIPEKLTLLTDFSKMTVTSSMIDFYSLGLEIVPFKILALRIGTNNNEVTAGFGINIFEILNFDYALASHYQLGNSHRVSVNLKFGSEVKTTPEIPEEEKLQEVPPEEELKLLPEEDVEKFQEVYQEAISLYHRGLFAKAFEKFNAARQIDPNDTDIPLYIEKLKLVSQIIPQSISPGKTSELVRRGVVYFVEGYAENSVKTISYALSLEPENFSVKRLLARIEEFTKIKAEKVKPLEGMTLIDQKSYEVLVNFRKKDYSKVIQLCEEILILEPDNVLAYKQLGSAFFSLGDKEKAKKFWTKALEYGPDKKLEEMIKSMEK